jgi:hypothetical protein
MFWIIARFESVEHIGRFFFVHKLIYAVGVVLSIKNSLPLDTFALGFLLAAGAELVRHGVAERFP